MGTEANLVNTVVVAGDHSDHSFKLVDFKNFIRTNPMSDKFAVKSFHHIEFWCSDATNASRRFSWGLGMPIILKSDLSTGNSTHASYLLKFGQLNFLFTAPYSPSISSTTTIASIPSFSHSTCRHFTSSHGLAVRAIAVEVHDAELAFSVSVAHGAKPPSPPITLGDLFASCFVHPGHMENVVELVLDSSRYFVLKIEDQLTYPFVVKACGELEMYRFGLLVNGMVLSGGVDSSTFVGNSLMGMYMSFGEYDSDNIHTLVYI